MIVLMGDYGDSRNLLCLRRKKKDLEIVKENWKHLKHVEYQTPAICMAAVQQNGYALEYVKEQTPEICLAAVRQDARALGYVEEQTSEICLIAVQQDGLALMYVEEQTPAICEAAVKQNKDAACYIEDVELRRELERKYCGSVYEKVAADGTVSVYQNVTTGTETGNSVEKGSHTRVSGKEHPDKTVEEVEEERIQKKSEEVMREYGLA